MADPAMLACVFSAELDYGKLDADLTCFVSTRYIQVEETLWIKQGCYQRVGIEQDQVVTFALHPGRQPWQ